MCEKVRERERERERERTRERERERECVYGWVSVCITVLVTMNEPLTCRVQT